MSPPQFEVELVDACAAFNEALEDSAPGLRGAAERYGALLDEYMGRLRRHSRSAPAAGPTRGRPSSLGAAAQPALDDDWMGWARAERERVEAHLKSGGKKGGMK